MVPPFVNVGGVWHLVVNWVPEMTTDDWKLLRPLTTCELNILERSRRHSDFEAWAVLVPDDEARTASRS